jgi:hypothetical protein
VHVINAIFFSVYQLYHILITMTIGKEPASLCNSKAVSILTGQDTGCVAKFLSGPFHSILSFKNIGTSIERRFIQKSF